MRESSGVQVKATGSPLPRGRRSFWRSNAFLRSAHVDHSPPAHRTRASRGPGEEESVALAGVGHDHDCPVCAGLPGVRVVPDRLRAVAGAAPVELRTPRRRPRFCAIGRQYAYLPDHRHQPQDGRRAVPVGLFRAGADLDQVAVADLHPALGGAVDPVDPVDDLDIGRFQQRVPADRRWTCRPDACAGDAGHPLFAARPGGLVDGGDRVRVASGAAVGVFHDEAPFQMKLTWRRASTEAKLLLVGIPVLLWTMLPIYHLFLFAISPKESAFAGKLWPDHPTLHNFEVVFRQQHYYLSNFWLQLWNSLLIAVTVGMLTLIVATAAAFAISRLKVKGGRTVMNLALFTYFIPAAFLAVPMYRTMGIYGLLNSQWALILAMVTIAAPYSIWVLKQASDKLPYELDEAARMDGASPLQLFRLVYVPLMMPSLVAIGTYALLLAWNEYLYAFLLLSHDRQITLGVALGNFLAADDSPWELLMTVGLIYAMPPAAIYYVFKRYMVGGLTAGAVKSCKASGLLE